MPGPPRIPVLDALIAADGAHHAEITFADGQPYAIATVDAAQNEVAVYEGGDLSPALLTAARQVPAPTTAPAAHYAPPTTKETPMDHADAPTTHDYDTRPVLGKELTSADTLVGESGGLSSIYQDARPSAAMMGMVVVETEHGPLYLDPDEEYDVLDA